MRIQSPAIRAAIAVLPFAIMLAACSRGTDISAPKVPSAAGAAPANPLRSSSVRISDDMQRGSDCNIEFIDKSSFEGGIPEVVRGDEVLVTGWVVDAKAGVAPTHALLRLEARDGSGAWEHPIGEWRERPDVVAHLGGAQGFLKSGFKQLLSLSTLEPRQYQIYLAFPTPEGEVVCGVGRSFNLKE